MMSFLGTGGHLPGQGGRATPCFAYVRQKDAWLIEAGEDAQRQLMYADHIKPSKVSSDYLRQLGFVGGYP